MEREIYFLCDVFDNTLKRLEKDSGFKYLSDKDMTRRMRIIMDHIRAVCFLISDGVMPSNTDRGYLVRRLIRRALVSMKGITTDCPSSFAHDFIDVYKDKYKELEENRENIIEQIKSEEKKFLSSLKKANKIFEKKMDSGGLSMEDAFTLKTSYGLPYEIIKDLFESHNQDIDEGEFMKYIEKHRNISKGGSDKKFKGGLESTSDQCIKYHTATHLLHQALRDVLGDSVMQRGSNINEDRMRFDFSHNEKLTQGDIERIEKIVNDRINDSLIISYEDMPISDAKKLGAIGVFDDKYKDMVRVYSIGDYSKEFCGGPHTENTKELGKFRIVKEESVSKGVRRIKGILE